MAIANIVLADAAGTPVNHTFVPTGWQGDTFWWTDQSQSNAIGYWRISARFQAPPSPQTGQNSKDRTYRVTVALHEPVLEVLSGSSSGITPAPTIAYTPRCITEYILPERSNLLDRSHLLKMSRNLQNDAHITGMVTSLLNLFG